MTGDVEPALTLLPEPEPPPSFSRTVMARVSRAAEARRPARLPGDPLPSSRKGSVGRARELAPGVGAIAGVAVAITSWAHGLLETRAALDLVPSLPWLSIPVKMPLGRSATLALALGLLLYVAGLFAPLHNRDE